MEIVSSLLMLDIIIFATFNIMLKQKIKFPYVTRLLIRQARYLTAGLLFWLGNGIRPQKKKSRR